MDNAKLLLMQYIVKLLSPSSFAYGNIVAFQRAENIRELKDKLKPGDVILSRTNNAIYQMSRKYMGINYDHVAVVINRNEVIHISPPIISKIDVEYFINTNREPYIIRPKIQDQEKYLTVLHNFLGQKYNSKAILSVVFRQLLDKLQKSGQNFFSFSNLKESRICSDAVLYAICKGSPSIKEYLENQYEKSRFSKLGYFLPDQIGQILLENGSEIILKSSIKSEYQIVNKLSKGGQKVIDLSKNIVKVGSSGYERANTFISQIKNQIQPKSPPKSMHTNYNDKEEYNIRKDRSRKTLLRTFQLILLFLIRDRLNRKVQIALLVFNATFIIGQLTIMVKKVQKLLPNL